MTLSRFFKLLPSAVFAYIAVCFLLHPQSLLHSGTLADPDDYMRLNQVINWFETQQWFNTAQPRLDPDAHVVVHWARLVDLPIALFMLPVAKAWGLTRAALIAAFLVPMVLLVFLLSLVQELGRVFVEDKRATLTTVMLLFAPLTLFNFTPGRVDHHGYQVLIAGFSLVCLDRMIRDEQGRRFAVYAAIAYACGLWIGAEILPWLVLFNICVAAIAAWQGGAVLRNAVVFGLALTLATIACLGLAVPPADYFKPALSWFSCTDVLFAALTAGVFLGAWCFAQKGTSRAMRFLEVALLGLFASTLFFYLTPEVWKGPYADYDDFDSALALVNINEAQPLMRMLRIDPHNPLTFAPVHINFARYLALPLAALGFIISEVRSGDKRRRPIRIIHGVFLLAAMLLAFLWQARVGWFMQLFAIAPLTGLLARLWDEAKLAARGRARYWTEIGIFMLLGPLPVVLIPAIYSDAPFYSDVLLFPAARSPETCPLKDTAAFLADPRGFGGRPHTILASANIGPELLFRTPHNVVAADFNVPGNRDVYDFFNARDDATAHDILRKTHADLVLTCRTFAPFYAGQEHPKIGENMFLRPGKDGKLQLLGDLRRPTMIEKLVIDRMVNMAPRPWLMPVEIPGVSDYLLYEVH